jgi:hypothetical protein
VTLRYVHALFNQVAQSTACAHHHQIEHRCCRWLLMTRDRMPSDEFLLTQEFPRNDAWSSAAECFSGNERPAESRRDDPRATMLRRATPGSLAAVA